jgi:hypothetical protein
MTVLSTEMLGFISKREFYLDIFEKYLNLSLDF